MTGLLAARPKITIGDKPTFQLFGITFDTYVIFATLVAAAIVLGDGMAGARDGDVGASPASSSCSSSTSIEQVRELTDSVLGEEGPKYVALGVMLFFFILVCNWLEFIPSTFQVGVTPGRPAGARPRT